MFGFSIVSVFIFALFSLSFSLIPPNQPEANHADLHSYDNSALPPVIDSNDNSALPPVIDSNDNSALPPVIDEIDHGKPVNEGKYPWMVALKAGSAGCTGTIISKRHILTAGHCIEALMDPVTVFYGDVEKSHAKKIISKVGIQHENYTAIYDGVNVLNVFNDIALYVLPRDLKFGRFVQPIKISKHFKESDKISGVSAGWGYAVNGSHSYVPDHLQEGPVQFESPHKCEKETAGAAFL